MKIKVDYSSKVKRTGNYNIPGQFSIYIKKHWWNKWKESTEHYADYNMACYDARQIRELEDLSIPKYF